LIADHQGAKFLIFFAHYLLFAGRGAFVTGFIQKSIIRNPVTHRALRANIRQASENPPTTRRIDVKLLLSLIAALPAVSLAQSQSGVASGVPSVAIPKTTEVLVIETAKQGVTPQQIVTVMPAEIRATVKLYFDGKIRQWYSRGDGKGVVFLVDAKSEDEARAVMDSLPLAKQELMDHEYVPVGPLMPLRALMGAGAPNR
jgi:hypothetical protein